MHLMLHFLYEQSSNRTIVELKSWKMVLQQGSFEASNRTIVELKLETESYL